MLAILLAIVVGAVFYATRHRPLSRTCAPWQSLVHERFATAVAFERAMGSQWIVSVIMATALLSLVKIFNGNFVAASRLLFALGRRGLADPRLGVCASCEPYSRRGGASASASRRRCCMFAGESILVPITEVGSLASALGWMASCAAFLLMRPAPFGRAAAVTGIVVTMLDGPR